jgi:hypothetical protein
MLVEVQEYVDRLGEDFHTMESGSSRRAYTRRDASSKNRQPV